MFIGSYNMPTHEKKGNIFQRYLISFIKYNLHITRRPLVSIIGPKRTRAEQGRAMLYSTYALKS